MAILYTPEEIQGVLRTLRIKPKGGMVTTEEAARILSWRAKEEKNIYFVYTPSAVRRRIQLGSLEATQEHKRANRYKVEDIFDLTLVPRRKKKQRSNADTEESLGRGLPTKLVA